MKGKRKKWGQILLTVFMMFTMLSFMVMAKGEGVMLDKELLTILYEKTDNPEIWAQFIEKNTDDEVGKWLPLLIKKVASNDYATQKEVANVTYSTITEVCDWGPAVTKIVLDFGTEIDSTSLSPEMFDVKSVRAFQDFDFTTFSLAQTVTEHEAKREVTKVYISDEKGNRLTSGNYVTLEMKVGPTLVESSPFNYNIPLNRNEFVETSYNISLTPGSKLISVDNKQLTMLPTGDEEKADEIHLISDDFEHNQNFVYKDIDLLYASYSPEKASIIEGSKPLVIWLHGAGEGGKDTRIATMGNEVVNLATGEYQSFFGENGAYILVPQSPTMWMDVDGTNVYNSSVEGSDGVSYYTQALMALIENYVLNHQDIDTNRIYIGGCSNGGYMTVNMIMNYPDYFAAAYPICEAYSVDWITTEKITAIKDIPIWLTHAMSDSVVPIAEGTKVGFTGYDVRLDGDGKSIPLDNFSNALYTRLVDMKAKDVHYSRFEKVVDTSGLYYNQDGTPYEYMGHWSWIPGLNNESVDIINGVEITMFEWLGQQTK